MNTEDSAESIDAEHEVVEGELVLPAHVAHHQRVEGAIRHTQAELVQCLPLLGYVQYTTSILLQYTYILYNTSIQILQYNTSIQILQYTTIILQYKYFNILL